MFDDLLVDRRVDRREDEPSTNMLEQDSCWDTGAVWSTGQIPNYVWTVED
jgi:hypothetical protein